MASRRRIRRTAAAWVARLASDERTEADESRLRVWLDESSEHRASFEEMTDAWDSSVGLARAAAAMERQGCVGRRVLVSGAAASAVAAATCFWWTSRPTEFLTAVGERRTFMLEDESRVILDSDSILRVKMRTHRRDLSVVRGRAHFDVKSDPLRPFVVNAEGRDVIAVGTAFDVTREESRVVILLTEGQVIVRSEHNQVAMQPGDRLSFSGKNPQPVKDRPDLAKLTAWQRGYLVLDGSRLADAIAEMNRYSVRRLYIAGKRLPECRVSGTFSTTDPAAFARSVGILLDEPVTISSTEIVIGRISQ